MDRRLSQVYRSPAVRLAAYYVLSGLIIGALAAHFPWFRQLVIGGTPVPETGSLADLEAPQVTPLAGTFGQQVTQTLFLALLALLGALVYTAPIVWIHTVILRQEGYDRPFVRMLVLLPVVVAGVVQVVRGDLALAFALAGIVAAVRFRTTVKDLQNAVFAFAVIGVGLAAGTGALLLAAAISMVVSTLFYMSWRFNLGSVHPRLEVVAGGGSLADAFVPGESHPAVSLGHKDAVPNVGAQDLEVLSGHVERLADYVQADSLRRKKKYRELLLVYTADADLAAASIEALIVDHVSRWVEVDRIRMNGEDGPSVVVYLIRLKKSVKIGQLVEDFEQGEGVDAVELKPIGGLRDQLT